MGTLQSFDRMTFRYSYTTDSGHVVHCQVHGGAVNACLSYGHEVTEQEWEDAKAYALDQWNKARAAYLEEAQEQELADHIARNRNED